MSDWTERDLRILAARGVVISSPDLRRIGTFKRVLKGILRWLKR